MYNIVLRDVNPRSDSKPAEAVRKQGELVPHHLSLLGEPPVITHTCARVLPGGADPDPGQARCIELKSSSLVGLSRFFVSCR